MKRPQFGIRLLLLVIALFATIFAYRGMVDRTMRTYKAPLIAQLKEDIRQLEAKRQIIKVNYLVWPVTVDSDDVDSTLNQKRQQLAKLEQ